MFFINLTGDAAESFKSKYLEVATSYKGQGLHFLLGDVEESPGTLMVCFLVYIQVSIIYWLQNAEQLFSFSKH